MIANADGQVLVQIHAAGVNLLDSKIMSGEFKLILPYRMPLILGNDVAGLVVGVGSGVRRFQVWDEVYARPGTAAIGTFAEFISIRQADIAVKPGSVSMEEAASLPLVGLTAWQALVERANVERGQKVFIQAGSGGVGAFAIQLAKHLGPPSPPPPAPRMSSSSRASAQTSSSTTESRTSRPSSRSTTWCCTVWTARHFRSRCES